MQKYCSRCTTLWGNTSRGFFCKRSQLNAVDTQSSCAHFIVKIDENFNLKANICIGFDLK